MMSHISPEPEHFAEFSISNTGNVIPKPQSVDSALTMKFKQVIEEKIAFAPKEWHNVVVDKTGQKDVYKLTIDGKRTFTVKLKEIGEADVIQQFVEKKSFLSTLGDFFRVVGALFYRPFIDDARVGRNFHEAS